MMRRGEEGYGSLTATRVARAAKAAARVARAASVVKGDSGSLVILVLSLFFLLLMSSLAVVDISDNFLAKRQLIEIERLRSLALPTKFLSLGTTLEIS
jgi:hypothetical protein